MKAALYAAPLVVLAALASLAGAQLFDGERSGFERIERQAPARAFPRLRGEGELRFAPPPGGRAVIVNLFASWCAPCEAEHPILTRISEDAPGRLYGVLYKDSIAAGEGFLDRMGDPFVDIGTDENGQGGLDFGLTGVPETFLVDKDGFVRLHIRGPLTEETARDLHAALGEADRRSAEGR